MIKEKRWNCKHNSLDKRLSVGTENITPQIIYPIYIYI